MTKNTYEKAYNKKAVREHIFKQFENMYFDQIVGLAGPDIKDYVKFCNDRGFNNIEIWENNPKVMVHQLASPPEKAVRYMFGNILDTKAPTHTTLFDLDYCVSIRYMKEHLQKFQNKFIMTFSTRIGIKETINSFFKFRKEAIVKQYDVRGPGKRNIIFETTAFGSQYLFITYHDTSAMCCFAKIR
jgi:hypothetical protein